MFGLGQEIGGDPFCVGACVVGEDDGFGWAGGEVDGAVAADELFCGGDVAVAGAEDFFDARDGVRAVGEGGDGLGAADLGDLFYAEKVGGGEEFGIWVGADDDDVFYAGDLGGDDGHYEGGD